MKTGAVVVVLLAMTAPAWGQTGAGRGDASDGGRPISLGLAPGERPRFGPSPGLGALEAYAGLAGPFAGSARGGVYLALIERAPAGPAVAVEVSGRLGEAGVLRLVPDKASGRAAVEARLEAAELMELWRETRGAFDADFAAAQTAFEARAGAAAPACSPGRYVAFIGEDGLGVRRSEGELGLCGERWWDAMAPRLWALAGSKWRECAVSAGEGLLTACVTAGGAAAAGQDPIQPWLDAGEAFDELDKNGDLSLSAAEAARATEADRPFLRDGNGDGRVTLAEWLEVLGPMPILAVGVGVVHRVAP